MVIALASLPPREGASSCLAGVSGVGGDGDSVMAVSGEGVSRLLLPSDSSPLSSRTEPGVCTRPEGTCSHNQRIYSLTDNTFVPFILFLQAFPKEANKGSGE